MTPFKHAYMVLATDFELEPVIDQYVATYPDAEPRNYRIVCKLQNERHEGDYCYIIVYEHVAGRKNVSLTDYIQSYCQLHNKVAAVQVGGHVFPDLAKPSYGDASKYGKC